MKIYVGTADATAMFMPYPGETVSKTAVPRIAITSPDADFDFKNDFWKPRMQTIADMLAGEEGIEWSIVAVNGISDDDKRI